MPKNEIKNTFIGGKMNKDLDERLIPVGEYRDAMNVQVTTSDGSDVGSLHNIMGNKQVSNIVHSEDAYCIGSIADEKVNKLYEDGNIIIYWTARGTGSGKDWSDKTKEQLDEWGAKYNVVKVGKPMYDLFICDKAINSRAFFGMGENNVEL